MLDGKPFTGATKTDASLAIWIGRSYQGLQTLARLGEIRWVVRGYAILARVALTGACHRASPAACGVLNEAILFKSLRVRSWHIASFRYAAPVGQQLGVKRTRHGRGRSDAIDPLRKVCLETSPDGKISATFRRMAAHGRGTRPAR